MTLSLIFVTFSDQEQSDNLTNWPLSDLFIVYCLSLLFVFYCFFLLLKVVSLLLRNNNGSQSDGYLGNLFWSASVWQSDKLAIVRFVRSAMICILGFQSEREWWQSTKDIIVIITNNRCHHYAHIWSSSLCFRWALLSKERVQFISWQGAYTRGSRDLSHAQVSHLSFEITPTDKSTWKYK